MKKYILFFLLFSVLFFSCDDENLNNIAASQFVVEAFLYAGEPIEDIRIKTTFPLVEEEDTSVPINDADVTLIKNGQRFDLIASGEEGFYHYPDNDVMVETNDVFQLEVIHNGITATAETTVPTPTTGLSLSQDSLFVPTLPFSSGRDSIVMVIQNFMSSSSIEATWENLNEDLYFMVVESVSDELKPIFPSQVIDALSRFRFVSEPTDAPSLTFLAGALESFGKYSVKVYHINQEYAGLYENREQDSRDLNEPPSNISNALGVFSAFNSEEAFFDVVRE
ncbi:MAG: DUF4249 family protein [Chitinophagales bacterium]